ncbi:unnamed protein product [Symbiodinium sp. CCMP2592]|nr:unnamed protein product [Symbiodinium sp. CCMP2592]
MSSPRHVSKELTQIGGLHAHRDHTSWDVSGTSDVALLVTDAETKVCCSHNSVEGAAAGVKAFTFESRLARQTEVLGCWGSGGRYWHSEVQTSLGPRRSTLCVPYSCTQADVEAVLAPIWFQRFIGVDAVTIERLTAQELSHWADLRLDFAIVGLDGCGTTSLRHNLAKHPEINFTHLSVHNQDEDFFFMEMGRQTLPLMSQVQRLNAHRDAMVGVKRLGIYQPVMWREEVLEFVFSLIPDMRIVLAVCDPVDRFERKLHLEHDANPAELKELMARKLEDKTGYLRFATALASMKRSFGDHLLVLEKDELNDPETFERAARFLDLASFPSRARLKRYNSRGRHRTPVCSQPSLIDAVKDVMSPEYQVLEALLPRPSERLRRRLTRCESPDGFEEENLKLLRWRDSWYKKQGLASTCAGFSRRCSCSGLQVHSSELH